MLSMIPFSQMPRLWAVWRVYRKYGLAEAIGKPVRRQYEQPIGVRLRAALEELGPVFVKFGQALSTRPDVLPVELAAELAKLQEQVTPFEGAIAREIIESELGLPVEQAFAAFDETPLASASVAQVHAARLPDVDGQPGMDVVIKVVRPGIRARVRRDINLLRGLAKFVDRTSPLAERLRPLEIVAEYEKVIFDELDMLREAANASQLRRNWLGSEMIYHPAVFWDYSTQRILVLERLYGLPVDATDQLREAGVDFKTLAEWGVELFFREVFYFNFFHADMHPGNVRVDPSNPAKPRYLALDFGIVGSLTPDDQRYLAENFVAFFDRDYQRVAELHIESGWVPRDTRIDEFTGAIRAVCEPIFNKPLKDISFGDFLVRLFSVARRFNMTVQPQLVLLQKTILQIEGLGRQLYPDLDLWETAQPIMQQWMKDRVSPTSAAKHLRQRLPGLIDALPKTIATLEARLDDRDPRGFASRADIDALRQDLVRQQKANRRSTIIAALIMSAAVIYGLDGYAPPDYRGIPLMSWLMGLVAIAIWFWGRLGDD